MSSNVVIGWVNNVLSATLTASSAEASLPVTNLQNDIGDASTAWQTPAGVTGGTFTIMLDSPGTWRAFALCRTNLTPSASITFTVFSGGAIVEFDTTVPGPLPGYRQVIALADADITGLYCLVSILDPTNPDGFLNVPLAFAGPAWVPLTGISWQSTFGRDSLIDEQASRGGQEYPIARWQRRRWELALDAIDRSELWDDAQELDRVSREAGNVLFIPNSTSATMTNEAVFGRLESVADVNFMTGVFGVYGWRFRIKERL